MKKRSVAALVSLVLLACAVLGGCGKKGETVKTNAGINNSKEHVYKAEMIEFQDIDPNNMGRVFYYDDKILVTGQIWEDMNVMPRAVAEETTGEVTEEQTTDEMAEEVATEDIAADDDMDEEVQTKQKMYFAVYDYEGNQLSYTETEMGENEWMNQCVAGKEDALYCVMESYFEDDSDPDNYIWEEYYSLVKKNLDGTEEWRIDLDELMEEQAYVNALLCDNSGQLWVFLGNGETIIVDKDSNVVKEFQVEEENMGNVLMSAEGKIMVTVWGEQGQTVKVLDETTGQLSENYEIPGNSYNYSYYPGKGYDLFLTDNNALYGYNLGEETMTELMNFVDSDLDSYNLYDIYAVNDTQFYAGFYSYSEEKSCYALFTKVPPEEVVEKKVLTLGCTYLDDTVRRQVVKFNKENEQYRIQIKDYSKYNTEEDYSQCYIKLNADIVSGNVPDILVTDDNIPVESYIAKGLFEDLYPFIDADEEMERSDFMANVFDALSVDGKLYQLVPSFNVLTVAGKTSDVGEESGWTLDELNALAASKPEGTEVFWDVIRETVLGNYLQMTGEEFVNWETGECHFDSEGFVKFLDFLKQFPAEYDEEKYADDEFWATYSSAYRDGRALLQITNLTSFSDYNWMEKGSFGEDITLIGFPTESKNGSAIDYYLSFSLSAKSEYKEGAWEFLRYFLSYDYQKDCYGFPVNLERYEELKQEAMQRPYYYDENNQKVEYDETFYLDDLEIVIPPMTKEEVQEVEDFLFSVNQVAVYDEDLMNIISEEAAAYFEGQKSAEEVAGIIQSRARIYVNENR